MASAPPFVTEYPHDHRHFLPGVTTAEWDTLVGYCTPRVFRVGERLYEPGGADRLLADRALVFVRAGRIGVTPIDSGMAIGIVPPAVFGRPAFFTGEALFWANAVIEEECDTLVLTSAAFTRLGAEHPHLAITLAMDVGSEMALTLSGRLPALLQRGVILPEE